MSARWPYALGLASLVAATTPAHAWTDAHVETVEARVVIDADAHAEIELELIVRVRAGWLEGLEVAGLDPELTLADPPLTFVSMPKADESGRVPPVQRFRPSLRLRDDRVSLRFRRRNAPRRGRYRATLRYATSLATHALPTDDEERVRVPWTLPGWQSGLDGVVVEIRAPEGTVFPPDDDRLATIRRTRSEEGDVAVLRWRRAHLPRTMPWTVAVEVPREHMASLLAERERTRNEATPETDEDSLETIAPSPPGFGPTAGALAVALLALLALLLFDVEARRRHATPRPWIPMARWLRIGLLLGVAAVAVTSAGARAWFPCFGALAVVLLLAGQRRADRRAPGLGRWRAIGSDDLAHARKTGRRAPWALTRWADASTGPGVLVWLLASLALVAIHGLDVEAGRDASMTPWLWALLPLPLFVATRHRLPRSPEARLRATLRLAGKLRTADGYAPALAIALHESADGRWQDARIRLITETRPPGLLRLDIALDDDDVAHGVLLTREKTDAETQAAGLTDAVAIRGPGGRMVRVTAIDEALRLALLFRPPRPKERRRAPPARNRHRVRPPAAPLH